MKIHALLPGIRAAAALLPAFVSLAAPIDTWHVRNSGTDENLNGVAYGNGMFIAVGEKGTIVKSPDGVTWTSVESPTTVQLLDVAFGNGVFVALGFGSPKTLLTSINGVMWTARPTSNGGGFLRVDFDGTRFFIIEGKGSFRTSTDGVDWTAGDIGTGGLDPASVGGFNGQWVVAGYKTGNNKKGMLFSAPGLSGWEARASTLTNNLFGVGHIAGNWVVAGQGGVLASSPNGVDWTPRSSQTTGFIWDFASNGKYLVGASQWGRMIHSENGLDWTRVETELDGHQKSVTFGAGTFVSVGWTGQVLQSDPVPGGSGGGGDAPRLGVRAYGGDHVILSWPLAATGWKLESSANLTTWGVEPAPVVNTATEHTVTLPCAGARGFRLRQ